MSDKEGVVCSTPHMHLVPAEVTSPVSFLQPLALGLTGVVVGPGHVPGLGPALFLGVQPAEGQAQIAVLSPAVFTLLVQQINSAAEQLSSGAFSAPPVKN